MRLASRLFSGAASGLGVLETTSTEPGYQKARDAEAGGPFALEFPTPDAIAEGGPAREDAGLRVQAEHGRRRGRQEQQQQSGAGVRARQGPVTSSCHLPARALYHRISALGTPLDSIRMLGWFVPLIPTPKNEVQG